MNGTEFARVSGSYSTAFIGTYELTGQDIANSTSTFLLRAYFYYGGGTKVNSSKSGGFYLDSTWVHAGEYSNVGPGYHLWGEKYITVTHNNDGSWPGRNVEIKGTSYHMNGSSSGGIWAPDIPRQANVTDFWDFNDEQNPTITYNNLGGFRINARLEFPGANIRRDNISNTGSYTFSLTDAERKLLRQKCTGNSMSVRGVIATCIGGTDENYWSYQDKIMTIINANPEFSNFTFEDINTKTTALTGNNQNIIKGYSNVKVTIPVVNKATAKKEATMSKYRFTCGDKNSPDTMAYSSDNAVTGTINGVPNGTFNVYATDSRNNSTLVTKLANQVIDYTPLIKSEIEIGRNNGVSEQVTLKFEGQINIVNFGVKTNSIKSAKFRYKSTETGSEWSTPESVDVAVNNGTFSFEGLVKGDTESLGFDVANSYQVEVIVEDELSEVIFTDKFGSGIPNIALAKNGVGIMGKYDDEVGGKFQVGGKRMEPSLVKSFSQGENDSISFTIDGLDLDKDGHYIIDFSGTSTGIGVIFIYPNGVDGLCDSIALTQGKNGIANGDADIGSYLYCNNNIHIARFDISSGGWSKAIIDINKIAGWPYFKSSCISRHADNTKIITRDCNGYIKTSDNITSLKFMAEQSTAGAVLKGCVVKIYRL